MFFYWRSDDGKEIEEEIKNSFIVQEKVEEEENGERIIREEEQSKK